MEDLLIALYRAPQGRSFHGVLRQRVDSSVRQRAFSARQTARMIISVSGAADGALVWDLEVWVDGDRRSRVDQAGSVCVQDGGELLTYVPGVGATAVATEHDERALGLPELWWRPRQMIGAIEIESVKEAAMLDRLCWRVAATRDLVRDPMMQMMMPGDRFDLWVDQETGVVLRCDEWFAGDEVASTEWVEFELLDRIDDSVFDQALPAGVIVRSEAEVILDHARALGVDLSDVDTSDAQQIARAMHQRSQPGLLDHHIATGEPPSDVAVAEAGVREAFAGLSEEDGESLPNVEAGDGLTPTVRLATERFAADGAEIAVREIKFLSDVRAAVVFAISTSQGQPLLGELVGEAVLRDDRWRVARSTFAQLMRMAGVDPPAPD